MESSAESLAPGMSRVPGWERYPWLRAAFSTRQGGCSSVYGQGDLNLDWTASDLADNVTANRLSFLRAAACGAEFELATVLQVHGAEVCVVDGDHRVPVAPDGKPTLRADGLMTAQPGVMLGIKTADCVPVLVADVHQRVVAAFHAGWRGTADRIVERGIEDLRRRLSSSPGDLVAAIGPCIGACCYAVGDDVRQQFGREFAYAASLFSSGAQPHLDLVEANRRQLLDAGISQDRIAILGECTACTRLENGTRKYFSYRSEAGFTGRMLSVIGIAPGQAALQSSSNMESRWSSA